MAGLKVKIGADASQFERTMRGVRKDIGGVKNSIMSIGTAVGAVWAVNKAFEGMKSAVKGVFDFIKESSKEAASIESLTMQFETLLGGAEAAKARIEEITQFAATTPFEIKELAATSKMLQNLGGNLLATGDGLRMVGDAAAIAGQPIGEVGLHIGRLFNAITSGTSAGESVNRLQELGLIGGDVKRSFEDLAKAQKKGDAASLSQAKALELLQGVLYKTEGAMERLATTTEGKLSNMRDGMDQLQTAFGLGFNEGFKDILDATNEFLPTLKDKFSEAGNIVGTAIREGMAGDPEMLLKVGETIGTLIGQSIVAGVKIAIGQGKKGILKALEDINPLRKYAKELGLERFGEGFMERGSDKAGKILSRDGQSSHSKRIISTFQQNMQDLRAMQGQSAQGVITGNVNPISGNAYTKEERELLRQIRDGITTLARPQFSTP